MEARVGVARLLVLVGNSVLEMGDGGGGRQRGGGQRRGGGVEERRGDGC